MSSSDSEDDRMAGVRRAPEQAAPIPKKTHVIGRTARQKRVQCSQLIRNKWFIIGTSCLILLIIVAIVLGVTLGKKSPVIYEEEVPLQWWQNTTVYRIYVSSFVDSDRDGLGDFKGIQEKLGYLKELGVDVLWLSPIQNTNTVSGTDVKDSKEVKTEYGMMKDFQDLILAAQAIGMKVIMDLVMNHSGTSHTWFKQSLLLTPPFKDYYVWSRGKNSMNPAAGTNQPPNNWISIHGGSAWQWNEVRAEYYLRQFWKNEPDLNYRNPQIVQEMSTIANFWFDKGIDGFYLRDAPFLYEDSQLMDENALSNSQNYSSLSHNYTRDLPDSYQAVNNIFFNSIQPRLGIEKLLILETNDRVMSDEKWTQSYKMMTTSALYHLNPIFDGIQLKNAVQHSLESFNKTKVWPIWTLGNEERSRILSKFNQLAIGLQVISILLPGSPSIYYGEEIQLTNYPSLSYRDTVDSVAKEAGPTNYSLVSRDPFHTPMKWNSSLNAGFTSAPTPWLPINNMDPTVDGQNKSSNSVMNTLKDLIAIKKSSITLLNGTIEFPIVEADVFSFTRIHPRNNTGFLVVWNVGNQRKTLSFYDTTYIPNEMTVIRKIRPDGGRKDTSIVKKSDVTIEPKEIIVFSFWKQSWYK